MGVLEVKDRVQRLLTQQMGRIEIDAEGDYTFAYESTRLHVSVYPWEGPDLTIVSVYSIVLWEVPGSPELFEYIATGAFDYRLGALSLYRRTDGTFNVNFSHRLIGETMDPEELKHTVGAVAVTADELDDEVKNRFGGKRWADL